MTQQKQPFMSSTDQVVTRNYKANVYGKCVKQRTVRQARGGEGGTAIYGLYRYVPLGRVWFSSSLL